MLTGSQEKIFAFIGDFYAEHCCTPTLAEIAKGVGITSRSHVFRSLRAIAAKGLIEITANSKRNIVILKPSSMPGCLPLLGKIAAGEPIEAISNEQWINLTEHFVATDRFLLQVKGDSMIEDNICDGDIVVIKKASTSQNGQIVVALVDNDYVTLKRFFTGNSGEIILVPANNELKPMTFEASRIQIQGIFMGLLRLNNYGF